MGNAKLLYAFCKSGASQQVWKYVRVYNKHIDIPQEIHVSSDGYLTFKSISSDPGLQCGT